MNGAVAQIDRAPRKNATLVEEKCASADAMRQQPASPVRAAPVCKPDAPVALSG